MFKGLDTGVHRYDVTYHSVKNENLIVEQTTRSVYEAFKLF